MADSNMIELFNGGGVIFASLLGIALFTVVLLVIKTIMVLRSEDIPEKRAENKIDEASQKSRRILTIVGLVLLIIGEVAFIIAVFFLGKNETSSKTSDSGISPYWGALFPVIWVPTIAAFQKRGETTKRQKLIILGIVWILIILIIAGLVGWYLISK